MPKGIFSSDWTVVKSLGRGKTMTIVIPSIIVSGDNVDEIINDEFYIKRAIGAIADQSQKTIDKYKVVSVKLNKKIGEKNE